MHRIDQIISLALLIFAFPTSGTAQTLGPCPEPFDGRWKCGSIRVPENRQNPRSRTIRVEVRVRYANNPEKRPPIVPFSGGPGAPTASVASPTMFARQADTHDLVLIDQRGTGKSNGFHCELGLAADASRAFGQLYPMDELVDCYGTVTTRADPNQYTTGDFIEDVEAVRKWLGYEKMILSGGSYGTRSAMTYMATYPDRVAGAVLNGVMPPQDHAPLTYARSVQNALDRVFADCAAQTACRTAYPNLESDFNNLVNNLREQPVAIRVTRPDGSSETVSMSATDLGYAVRIILYNRGIIPQLPMWIHEAATKRDLTRFAQAHYDRAVGILGLASIGLHFSVFCAEDVPFVDDDLVTDAVNETFFGSYFIEQYRAGCRKWPIERRDRRSHEMFTVDVPVLLLSGRYDPVTPPEFAESVRARFPNSRHIVQGNGGHGAGGTCISDILNDFLEHLEPGRLVDSCASIRTAIFEVRPSPPDR